MELLLTLCVCRIKVYILYNYNYENLWAVFHPEGEHQRCPQCLNADQVDMKTRPGHCDRVAKPKEGRYEKAKAGRGE